MTKPKEESFSLEHLPEGSMSPVGLKLPRTLDYEQWAQLGPRFHAIHRRLGWYVGDWINFGEQKFGEKYAQAVSETGYDSGYLANLAWICRTFEQERRREALSFRHHQMVAGLDKPEQDRWLLLAEEKGWTSEELAERLKKKRKKGGGKDDAEEDPPQDDAAEWLRLTLKLTKEADRKDVRKALARGVEVYGVKTYAEVVAHWAVEALANWRKEKK